jgi:hypothetical protein
MLIDRRLRQAFHGAAPAVKAHVWNGLSGVHARRRRRRQIQLVAIAAAAIVIAIAAIAGPDVWEAIRTDRQHPPAEEPPAERSHVPQSLLSIYTVTVPATSGVLLKYQLIGRWKLRLSQGDDQNLRLIGDEHQSVSDPNAPTFIPTFEGSYEVSGSRLTTDVLADTSWCKEDPSGTYLWRRSGSTLELTVLEDSCAVRRALLAQKPWRDRALTSVVPPQLVGTYRTTLEGGRSFVRNGLRGRWSLHLRPDGRLIFEPPSSFEFRNYGRVNDMSFRRVGPGRIEIIRGFVTHCTGFGTYGWRLQGSRLTFELVEDDCPARRIVFSSQPWLRT